MALFALYTVIIIIANACSVKIMHALIQPDQLLGFWDKVLHKMDKSDSKVLNMLVKPLGWCELCFSHFLTVIGFVIYYLFMSQCDLWILNIYTSIIWYMVYVSCGTILSLYFLTQVFK